MEVGTADGELERAGPNSKATTTGIACVLILPLILGLHLLLSVGATHPIRVRIVAKIARIRSGSQTVLRASFVALGVDLEEPTDAPLADQGPLFPRS